MTAGNKVNPEPFFFFFSPEETNINDIRKHSCVRRKGGFSNLLTSILFTLTFETHARKRGHSSHERMFGVPQKYEPVQFLLNVKRSSSWFYYKARHSVSEKKTKKILTQQYPTAKSFL